MNAVVVLIASNSEWRAVKEYYHSPGCAQTPFGETFTSRINRRMVRFFHSGVGKIAAAAAAQFALQRWKPRLLVNLGTCGGFAGDISRGQIILAERTLVYDIYPQMKDPQTIIRKFSSEIDLSWLREPYPQTVQRGLLLSADRDIIAAEIPALRAQYGAVAADWESGAVAWVAARSQVRCLILRGVSDLVGADTQTGDAMLAEYHSGTRLVMPALLTALPAWLKCAG